MEYEYSLIHISDRIYDGDKMYSVSLVALGKISVLFLLHRRA